METHSQKINEYTVVIITRLRHHEIFILHSKTDWLFGCDDAEEDACPPSICVFYKAPHLPPPKLYHKPFLKLFLKQLIIDVGLQ